jgi:hypothetical protein
MPREPISLVREGGFLEAEKMFVLSFEGSVSEKKYFEDFRKSTLFNNSGLIEVISLKRPTNRGSDPISVKKLLQEAKKEYRFKDTDEFWLILHLKDINELDEEQKRMITANERNSNSKNYIVHIPVIWQPDYPLY